MKLNEFNVTVGGVDTAPAMYNASDDEIGKVNMDDTRKQILTLKDLNKLKKLRAFRRLESLRDQDALALIYGQGGDDDENF